jgi:hypothetical protein
MEIGPFFLIILFRRVEDHMRPLVRSAMLSSAATERKARKAISAAVPASAKTRQHTSTTTTTTTKTKSRNNNDSSSKHNDVDSTSTQAVDDKHRDRPKEFAITSSAAPRRLNDVAMAPPELKRLPRPKDAKTSSGKQHAVQTKAGGVLSMAQRAMMEIERENAIRRYREMKERNSTGS